jgi:rhodanese-related sulfurtransferase/predicted transcriptional regulator
MTGREFKDLTFQQFAKIANAFGSPKRLEIIDILSQSEKDVDTISKETNMNFANTSRHLQILKSANIVKSKKEGVKVLYKLSGNEVIKCWRNLQALAEVSAAEIRETAKLFFEERNILEPISSQQLLERLENNDVTLIDVRPKEEYSAGHISGAVSFTLKELVEKNLKFPKKKNIIAYCRGPYCVLAAEAAKILSSKGYKVNIFKEDVNNWRNHGYPIEN